MVRAAPGEMISPATPHAQFRRPAPSRRLTSKGAGPAPPQRAWWAIRKGRCPRSDPLDCRSSSMPLPWQPGSPEYPLWFPTLRAASYLNDSDPNWSPIGRQLVANWSPLIVVAPFRTAMGSESLQRWGALTALPIVARQCSSARADNQVLRRRRAMATPASPVAMRIMLAGSGVVVPGMSSRCA
jgi:hypothetical protein